MNHDDCHECRTYADARASVLAPALADRSLETGETAQQIADRFMDGVHARHLSGLPILPTAPAGCPPFRAGRGTSSSSPSVHGDPETPAPRGATSPAALGKSSR